MPNCDAAFDVPLYAAAAALTPCSRPTLSTKHDFACCTSSNEIRLETHFAIFAACSALAFAHTCKYACEPLFAASGVRPNFFFTFEELAKAYNSCSR